jgi:hypothetical protein
MGMMINFQQIKKNLIINKKECLNYLNKIIEFLVHNDSLKITGQNFIIDDGFSL